MKNRFRIIRLLWALGASAWAGMAAHGASVDLSTNLVLVPRLTIQSDVQLTNTQYSVQIQYTNRIGGSGEWVTLTNLLVNRTPFTFFDESAVGVPARFYRLVVVTSTPLTNAATVTLNNLASVYDGTPKPVAVTTVPPNLPVTVTYNGGTAVPVSAGSYAVVATVTDPHYQGQASDTLIINKAQATMTLANVSATYDGNPKAVSVTTVPPNLSVAVTYNSGATVPINAGSYPVVATVNDNNYQGQMNGTLVIGKAQATVSLGNLAATYDGTAKPVTVTTVPANLPVSVTYNGSATVPVNAGSYPVSATVNDNNYQGQASGTLAVAKAQATVSLGNLAATYDGTAKPVTVTTVPAGLAVTVTYNGGATVPVNVGSYTVSATVNDNNYQGQASGTLAIAVVGVPQISGMAFIGAGNFAMGDTLDGIDVPVHTNYVSAFYMDTNLVSYTLWQQVYQWATNHGYSFGTAGSGKAANHPVHSVDWYDAVKWCNARSEKEGLAPCYYTDTNRTTVYKTGDINVAIGGVNWTANGYRLPTEAEWEKAARGGVAGQRFPRANTIAQSQANYFANTLSFFYDLGPTGYNAAYASGGQPYTSPVTAFAPNGYGLNDMAGNVRQWCWDWYLSSYYTSASGTDPKGPASGGYRVVRGGSWSTYAPTARCSARNSSTPSHPANNTGFRCVRSQ